MTPRKYFRNGDCVAYPTAHLHQNGTTTWHIKYGKVLNPLPKNTYLVTPEAGGPDVVLPAADMAPVETNTPVAAAIKKLINVLQKRGKLYVSNDPCRCFWCTFPCHFGRHARTEVIAGNYICARCLKGL